MLFLNFSIWIYSSIVKLKLNQINLFKVNMSNIRELDLSWNSMPSPPHNVWYILPYLTFLSLANNPMSSVKNESFLSLDRLQRLDLAGLEIVSVEVIQRKWSLNPNSNFLIIFIRKFKLLLKYLIHRLCQANLLIHNFYHVNQSTI